MRHHLLIHGLEVDGASSPEPYIMVSSPLGVSPSSSEGHAVSGTSWAQQYFKPLASISVERCDTIVSKSGETLGEYDFFYE
jgi:hypothetical protein